ncbi:MAG: TIGR01777 family oxidoreductase [Planctomycetota bacterium]|nr:TIGR01777 family oxidoreductase [Planctomycetota bacterium]
MKALITGGRGFVGNFLTGCLAARRDHVTIVSREPSSLRTARADVDVAPWLPDLSGYDAVFHLAGEPIFGRRWSADQMEHIRTSRISSTRKLVAAMEQADPRPRVFVCASAIGYYGERGEEVLNEQAEPGPDFLASVCAEWEREAANATELGVRAVSARLGIVLGLDGGALQRMLPPFRLGLGGTIGLGKHWMSWIHIKDLCQLLLHAADDDSITGPLNATAPETLTNRDFTRCLGRVLKRPTLFPVPALALRAALGPVAGVLTASQRCSAQRALDSGFVFEFPELEPALRQLLHR